MKNLEQQSGLPISLKSNFKLAFRDSSLSAKPEVRHAVDMKEVILDYDPSMAKKELYYMYRNLAQKNDQDKIKNYQLRFDITVMLPTKLGRELNKTKGHYHPNVDKSYLTYPELYQVIFGQAYFLIQRPNNDNSSIIEKCFLIKAQAGDKVVIPPNYGHVTINPGPGPLVMSNWVSDQFDSQYDDYLDHQGCAYYIFKSDKNEFEFEMNQHYSSLPDLNFLRPIDLKQFNLRENEPSYGDIDEQLTNLDFLNNPDKYSLKISKLFKDGKN